MKILDKAPYDVDDETVVYIDVGGPEMEGKRGRFKPLSLPLVTYEFDNFKEFCRWHSYAIQSLQNGLGPWVLTLPYLGYCGDCGDPIPWVRGMPPDKDYLCKDCRTALDKTITTV